MYMDPRSRKIENITYVTLWIVVIGLSLLDMMRARVKADMPMADTQMFIHLMVRMLPFALLFIINNFLLIPRLLLPGHIRTYFTTAAVAVVLLWVYQYFDFMHHTPALQFHSGPAGAAPHHPRPLIPLPLILDLTYGLLVVGSNLAVALMFQRLADRLEREQLMKANAESSLASLKAQINPHFYMNMLNNIHGMIELDPEKAQEMVIRMSQLMRYMIYDSSVASMPLDSEIKFMENYLSVMRLRYPTDKVAITTSFPPAGRSAGVTVPPLLFLVFIENAFKHGISYRHKSFVSVQIDVADGQVHFSCLNSSYSDTRSGERPGGIGLENVRRRLALIYGSKATLDISENNDTYMVNLTIPIHETPDTHN